MNIRNVAHSTLLITLTFFGTKSWANNCDVFTKSEQSFKHWNKVGNDRWNKELVDCFSQNKIDMDMMRNAVQNLKNRQSNQHNTVGGKFGALAIDSNQGSKWGWAVDYSSQTDANKRALQECGGNCKIVKTFAGGCAAYAADQTTGSTVWGWGTNSTSAAAQNRAKSECIKQGGLSCVVRVWGCNSD